MNDGSNAIAIVGMAGRFPGAADLDTFWQQLRAGREAVTPLTRAELLAAGAPPELIDHPNHVAAAVVLEDIDRFDAELFGYPPREAAILDPQHRLFLECAWQALEDAGIDPDRERGAIGIIAGSAMNTYLLSNLASHPELIESIGFLTARIQNDKDFLATRAAYKLNLKGLAMTVQTACSTSLLAVHLACRSLLDYECDVVLAGGVSVPVGPRRGYIYQEGGIYSPDGHCRAFDAAARGTVNGCGLGIVVLKRLADALADRDRIRALLLGSAVNNDGAVKVGFTAPSVDAQAEVIARAYEVAGVEPATVSYVEAHGTGTALGDPIEVAALARVFGGSSPRRGFCALGSVKSNLGHLDAAAGVASLIKTVLALEHGELPPSINCREPNPAIGFSDTAFRVQTELGAWQVPTGAPRRAGVSSFGVGGTNVHAVLEEAPPPPPSAPPPRPLELLLLSAASSAARGRARSNLAHHLERHPEAELADVAFTLAVGRRFLPFRAAVVAADRGAALAELRAKAQEAPPAEAKAEVVFLFPGQGSQLLGMGCELYELEPVYRRAFDRCAELALPSLGADLRQLVFAAPGDGAAAAARLTETAHAQPALFACEHALAELLGSWGIRPRALLGHSIGELTAACQAGVFELGDAVALAVTRGRLMARAPRGTMLAVELAEEEATRLAVEGVSLAAVNGRTAAVLSGPTEEIAALAGRLEAAGRAVRRLHVSHAFHSAAMDGAAAAFSRAVAKVRAGPPRLPVMSNVSGTWLRAEQARDPAYWGQQLRKTVRFAAGLHAATAAPHTVLLEVGPGRTLTTLARRELGKGAVARPCLRHAEDPRPELAVLLEALGSLWEAGGEVDWAAFAGPGRCKVALPTYPFERRRYWVEPAAGGPRPQAAAALILGEVEEIGGTGESEPAASLSEVAAAVAATYCEFLGLAAVQPHEDFFALGGHSLLATQVVSRLRDRFAIELTLEDFFHAPTVDALSTEIEVRRELPVAPSLPLLSRRAEPGPTHLSFGQERLWVVERAGGAGAVYHIPLVVKLRERLAARSLTLALAALTSRQAALRTVVRLFGEEPLQVVLPAYRPPLPLVDLAALADGERDGFASRLLRRWARRPFALAGEPPWRALRLRLAEEDQLLAFVLHHMLCDAWSLGVLARELAALYAAEERGSAADLAPLELDYGDYAAWEDLVVAGPHLGGERAYWQRKLAGSPPLLALPTDRPRAQGQSFVGAKTAFVVGQEVTAALTELARRERVTLFMLLLAGFNAQLAAWSGQEDICVGSSLAHRFDLRLEAVIGLFAKTAALRTDLGGDPTFRELLGRVRATVLGAQANADVPLQHIVRDLARTALPGIPPLFQVMLVFQNVPAIELGTRGAEILPVDLDTGVSRFDLTLFLYDTPAGLKGSLQYDTALFDPETIDHFVADLLALWREAAREPGRRLSELSGALAA